MEIQWDPRRRRGDGLRPPVQRSGIARAGARDAMERTLRWLARSPAPPRRARGHAPARQTLWPIVQGGTFARAPARLAGGILARGDVDRHRHRRALGGRTEGQSMHRCWAARTRTSARIAALSYGRRVSRRICSRGSRAASTCSTVSPPRATAAMAAPGPPTEGQRPGRGAAARRGHRSMPDCDCEACARFSRAYIRHLFLRRRTPRPAAGVDPQLRFLIRLAEDGARADLRRGPLTAWAADWRRRYFANGRRNAEGPTLF